jgi:hypothetical protein
MNGTLPDFLIGKTPRPGYYEKPDPYVNAPSCNVDLLNLSRYARQVKKPLVRLTSEEVARFTR